MADPGYSFGFDWIDGDTVVACAEILGQIEQLPADTTGALRFGDGGVVLLESRRICWAVARDMETRLSELLRVQRNPPLDPAVLNQVFRDCQRSKTPLGEALLASGHVTAVGLRKALLTQTTEALARIAHEGSGPAAFEPHANSRYDARFVFSSAEVLAAVGAARDRPVAALAGGRLRDSMVPGCGAFAYTLPDGLGSPVIIAVHQLERAGVGELLAVSRWASNMHGVSRLLDPTVSLFAASWRQRGAVVSWRAGEAQYAALCPNHAVSALLITRLESQLGTSAEAAA